MAPVWYHVCIDSKRGTIGYTSQYSFADTPNIIPQLSLNPTLYCSERIPIKSPKQDPGALYVDLKESQLLLLLQHLSRIRQQRHAETRNSEIPKSCSTSRGARSKLATFDHRPLIIFSLQLCVRPANRQLATRRAEHR